MEKVITFWKNNSRISANKNQTRENTKEPLQYPLLEKLKPGGLQWKRIPFILIV